MRVAVVDIGTNSTRLLIAEQKSQEVNTIKTGLITTRLGEGIGKQPYLLEAAMERTIEALLDFKQIISGSKVDKVVVAATSAVRDADNREEFLRAVKNRLGWQVQVLTGPEEAEMSYSGAVTGLNKDVQNPVVIDIGGGSTEFIWFGDNRLNCVSRRLGAVRMTEQDSSLQSIRDALADLLGSIKTAGFKNLLGVGGTLTTLAAIDQEMVRYDPGKIHGYFLKQERVQAILDRLAAMTHEERLRVPGLEPQRADIITAGVKIAAAVLEGLDAEGIVVSETGIMHGMIFRALNHQK